MISTIIIVINKIQCHALKLIIIMFMNDIPGDGETEFPPVCAWYESVCNEKMHINIIDLMIFRVHVAMSMH